MVKKSLGHVAVIGGCGFLGTNIVRLILEKYPHSRIAVLDVRTTNNRIPDAKNVSYHDVDITQLDSLQSLFEQLKLDAVIHTAALLPSSVVPDALSYKVNVDGTKNLLSVSRQTGVKAFVFTSSSSVVVGNVWAVANADESWPTLVGKDQPEYYSRTKAIAEVAVLEANRAQGSQLLTAALRPAGIFGEHDTTTLYRMLLITGTKTKFQIGDNDNLFDYTHVKNVAWAHLLAADALLQTHSLGVAPLDSERVDGEAFFITNGEPVYFWDFVRKVWQLRGSPADKNYKVSRVLVLNIAVAMIFASLAELVLGLFGKTPNFTRVAVRASCMTRYFNIDKARQRLQYEPLVSLEEGLRIGVAEVAGRQRREKESKKQA